MSLIPADNHEGIAIIIVGAVFGALSIFFFSLRVWARHITRTTLTWSDWTLFAALALGLGLIGGTVNTVIQGLGLNVDQVTLQQLENLSKGLIIGILLWVFSSSLVRISILLLYIDVFVNKTFRLINYIIIVLNIIYVIATTVVTFTICQPFAFNWDRTIPGGHCGNSVAFYTWMGVWNLISDVSTILLPLPTLWNLQMAQRKKMILSVIFGMGLVICALTVVRTVQTARVGTNNPTKDYASIGILSLLEPLLGICSASLPVLGPVFHRVFKSKFFDDAERGAQNKELISWPEESPAARKQRFKGLGLYRSLRDFDSTAARSTVTHSALEGSTIGRNSHEMDQGSSVKPLSTITAEDMKD